MYFRAGLSLVIILMIAMFAVAQDVVTTEEPSDVIVPDPNSDDPVERGAYLVRVEIACVGCHGAEDYHDDPLGVALSGGREFALPFGTVYAPNLTVLQDWTDDDIEFAIRYGVDAAGETLLPPMSYSLHENMADQDMADIIAYIRSLEPVENEVPEAELLPGLEPEFIRVVPEFDPEAEFDYPEGYVDDPLVQGTYMATTTSHCIACHGAAVDGVVDPTGPAAGEVVSLFPSLLSDHLRRYSDEELAAIFDDTSLFEMPTYSYQYLVDEDVTALIAWLRSQPSEEEWAEMKSEDN